MPCARPPALRLFATKDIMGFGDMGTVRADHPKYDGYTIVAYARAAGASGTTPASTRSRTTTSALLN